MLPSYEQLLRPQHKVSPRGGSSRSISRSIAPPPGSLLPPLSQQASSPTNRRNLGLILPPTLVISQLAPRYFFFHQPDSGKSRSATCGAGSPGWERIPFPRSNSLAGHSTGSAWSKISHFLPLGCCCCHQQLVLRRVFRLFTHA